MSVDLAVESYKVTASLPKEETFGLSAQIRRSSSSIAANIAEGHGRESSGSFVHFLRIAQGSLKELETHLLTGHKIGFVSEIDFEAMSNRCNEIGKMVRALIRSVQGRET